MLPATTARPSLAAGLLRWTARAGVIAWGAFWGWFACAVVTSESLHGELRGIAPAAALIAAILTLAIAIWRWPRVGGLLAVAAGGWAMWFFGGGANPPYLIALPPIVIGMFSIASGYAGRMPR